MKYLSFIRANELLNLDLTSGKLIWKNYHGSAAKGTVAKTPVVIDGIGYKKQTVRWLIENACA